MKKKLFLACLFPVFSQFLAFGDENKIDQKTFSQVHDFGKIEEGDSPKHTFYFTNETDENIKILQVRVPCGCAKTKVDKNDLDPGEKTKFSIQLDSKGRRGKIRKALYLLTDNKEMSVVKYIIKADIKPKPAPICAAPSVVNVGKMTPKEEKNIAFDIENKGTLDLTIDKGAVVSEVQIKTKLPVKVKAGQKQTFEIIVTAPFYEGKFRGNLMFKTNDKSKAKLWILVTADVAK